MNKGIVQIDIDSIENPTKTIRAMLATLDERFVTFLKKNTMDALETILNMRRLLALISSVPNSLIEAEVARHFISKEVCSIFSVEAASMFVLQADDSVMKYTLSSESEAFLLGSGDSFMKSVTKQVLQVSSCILLVSVLAYLEFNKF